MKEYWFPWESMNFITTPWKFQLTLVGSAVILSIVSWFRQAGGKSQNSKSQNSKSHKKPPSNGSGSNGGGSIGN
ncbi:hypothetical protein [Paenibacillus physcomitrellae]|uniref:Uncharacterized protein n=1 Tax=Paenibacillus physcomitrellae TaxID=1619311 RepID=A0ABQ1GP61_9BACL|nr:hypothetical protein [Paenibacillus physcomitrellae]GGA47651.1 hypothetical protein GCM10010917_36180 [Paenibacillus physcomitrellae]